MKLKVFKHIPEKTVICLLNPRGIHFIVTLSVVIMILKSQSKEFPALVCSRVSCIAVHVTNESAV